MSRLGSKPTDDNITPRVYLKKVFSETDLELLVATKVTNWRIQGMMLTGQYVLLDGHIYHKNEIYKVRYDLID